MMSHLLMNDVNDEMGRLEVAIHTHLSRNIIVRQIIFSHYGQCSIVRIVSHVPRCNGRTINFPFIFRASFLHFIDKHGFGNW